MSGLPKVAGRKGRWVELAPGTHRWCSCGLSKTQPFCDDKHKGTGFEPVTITVTEPTKVILCLCKRTKSPPYCDGSHAQFETEFDEYL